mgnify:CR=1 FL=1
MIVGIDIGGTTIKLGVVDEKGNILTASKFPTEEWTNPAEKLTELIQKECARFQKEYSIEGVGIGVPGQISADKESILELTNIPSLNGFALRSEIQKVLPKLKVVIENDARCAAMGNALAGVVVNHSGLCSASAKPVIFASGVKPNSLHFSPLTNTKAAPPSLMVEALAAVTVPSF